MQLGKIHTSTWLCTCAAELHVNCYYTHKNTHLQASPIRLLPGSMLPDTFSSPISNKRFRRKRQY